MQKYWLYFLNFSRFVVIRFKQDKCAQIASSLTFTTLLSIVPMLMIALTVFSALPTFQSFSTEIENFLLNNLLPEKAGGVISNYMQEFAESATRLTTVGILFLVSTALVMMLTIDKAFNTIWRVSHPRPLVKRLVVYWAVLTLAPLLVGASLSLTSWLVGLSMGGEKHISTFGLDVLKIVPMIFTTFAFALLFRLVPNRYVPRTHALIGAFISALFFEFMNRAFGYYISHVPTYNVIYGAFSSVPIFLMWVYLSWLSILVGAVITASLSHWRSTLASSLSPPATQMLDALRVLKIMMGNFRNGNVTSFPDLSKALRLGYDTLEVILKKLEEANMVCKAEGHGWLLTRDVGKVTVSEIFRLFVLDATKFHFGKNPNPLQQWLLEHSRKLEDGLDQPLEEVFSLASSSAHVWSAN